jgi:hypothetical protein
MSPPTSAEAAWNEFRQALGAGQTRARLRLLATVTTLVSCTDRGLAPEARVDLCVGIAARLAARVRAQSIHSPEELLHGIDAELADGAPSTALQVRLADSLAALPEAQQRALCAYYGAATDAESSDAHARRDALVALRGHLALDGR